ncbi:beta-glucosidase (plasmid) [Deinococcus aetherius]|uniref:Beta-glucosidase n=1 Tax=Deinococcus aetherius TaxID=200252 RepID=A0ABN6RMN8_9DEIO|nr:glycoside hydrolase family 3 C-terminal domain-containing protein [Deinococcus aetherius]BDP43596.1 beta-glucosidase [Deinococcus aetherius]
MNAEPSAPTAEWTLDEAATLTAGADLWSTPALPGRGVPPVRMVDGPMGVASPHIDERDVSLLMPCGTALAASWDTDLARRVGEVLAGECHRRGVQALLGPNLNLPRSPLAGRAFETYSEDPFLTGAIGAAWISGLQAHGVSAVAKHVVGNDSETQRHTMNSVMDGRTLREVYLRPFEMAAGAGVWAMMMAYNRCNGVTCSEQAHVMGILRGDFGWDGVLMSDWFGTHDGARSLNAGLDLEMPGPPRQMGPRVAELVAQGQVPGERVAEAARRVAGWARQVDRSPGRVEVEAHAVLTEAAAAGFVLLRNEGAVLPLRADRSLAVIGPNASVPCYQGATFARIALAEDVPTPLEALRRQFAEVTYEVGVPPEYRLPPLPALPITADGGERGLTVEYVPDTDPGGSPSFSEVRRTSTLVWFSDMPGGLSTQRPGTVRARTRLRPERSGVYRLFYGGTGDVTFLVDGVERGRRPSPVVSGDVMGHLLRGESDYVDLELTAGEEVRLEFVMTFGPARAQGLWYGARPPGVPDLLSRAEEVAARSEQVVLVVGETADSGVESRDRTTTRLPGAQLELIRRVCAANPRTVVVVNAAHAVDTSWAAQAAAVLHVWFPGQGFGAALAEVLAGLREPGGRLPVTFARQEADYPAFDLTPDAQGDLHYGEGVLIGSRSFAARGITPAFSLGHGLGYAEFEYGEVTMQPQPDGEVLVVVQVANTSGRAGKEVVQVYLEQPEFEGVPAHPELAAFAATVVPAGETRAVTLTIPTRAFRRWSEAGGRWATPPGTRTVKVGRSLGDIRWTGPLTL